MKAKILMLDNIERRKKKREQQKQKC